MNDFLFPLYAFENDDWSMFLIEAPDKVLVHIEPIDFENDEYLFWDAQGRPVRLTLERGKLTKLEEAENEITLREAFTRYSEALGVTVDSSGPLEVVWSTLQSNIRPPSRLTRIVQNVLGIGCLLIVLGIAIFIVLLLIEAIKAVFAH